MQNLKAIFDDDVPTSYYLFRPDTLLKVIGEYTFIYNPILKEWTDTKPFSTYVQTGNDFKVLKEEELKRIIKEINDIVIVKKEISAEDIQEMIAGKKKLSLDDHESVHQDLYAKEVDNIPEGDMHIIRPHQKITKEDKIFLFLIFIIIILVIIIICK